MRGDAHVPGLKKGVGVNASDRGHETIVVADDDDGVRFISKRILMDAGYCVLEARNGQEAVDLVSTNTGQVDGVMLDIAMPMMDGIEAHDRISEIAPGLPILFVSALMDRVINQTHLVEGVNFVRKPYTRQGLLSVLRANLDCSARFMSRELFAPCRQ